MRRDEKFQLLKQSSQSLYRSFKVTEGKESNTTEECFGGNAAPEFEEDIVSYCRKICYEALDCVTNAITDPFD